MEGIGVVGDGIDSLGHQGNGIVKIVAGKAGISILEIPIDHQVVSAEGLQGQGIGRRGVDRCDGVEDHGVGQAVRRGPFDGDDLIGIAGEGAIELYISAGIAQYDVISGIEGLLAWLRDQPDRKEKQKETQEVGYSRQG